MVDQTIKPGYKKTEIGTIPEEWEIANISKSSLLKGRIGWHGLTTKEYLKNGNYYLVTGTEFKEGGIDWLKCNYVSKERYDQDTYIQLQINDILVTKDGTIGKVAFVDSLPLPATLNSGVFVLRPLTKSYAQKFFYYILQSQYFKKFIGMLKAGSTISHLYQYSFNNFIFPMPPESEQKKIAKILSDTDFLIESLEKLITKKKNIKRGLMQTVLTKGIEHTRFKMTEIGEIPEDWAVKNLGNKEVSTIKMGQSPSSATYNKTRNGLPFLQGNAEFGFKYPSTSTYCSSPLETASLGDILISVRAPVGDVNVANSEYCIGRGLAAIQPNQKSTDSSFLYYMLNHLKPSLERVSTGSTFKAIGKEQLHFQRIPFPPLPEQQKISRILSDADKEIEALEQKRDKYKLLKAGMMQQLLTGGIRVK